MPSPAAPIADPCPTGFRGPGGHHHHRRAPQCARAVQLALWLLWPVGIVLGAPPNAHAQFDLSTFDVPAGPLRTPTIADPRVRQQPPLSLGLSLSWAHRVQRTVASGTRAPELGPDPDSPLEVSDQFVAQLSAAMTLFERFSLGVTMPVGLTRVAQGALDGSFRNRAGAGDLGLQLAAPLLDTPDIAVAVVAGATLPTADDRVLLGGDGVAWRLAGVAAVPLGAALELTGRLGFLIRERQRLLGLQQDDEAQLAIGLLHQPTRVLGWFVEVAGHAGVGSGLERDQVRGAQGRLGLRLRPDRAVSLDLGIGSGAFPTDDANGMPSARVFTLLRVCPWAAPAGGHGTTTGGP